MKNFNLIVHGITNMPNLTPSEKLVLIHLYTLKSMGIDQSHVEVSCKMLSYTRPGYQKILKRLIQKGYVEELRPRGNYGLTETNLF